MLIFAVVTARRILDALRLPVEENETVAVLRDRIFEATCMPATGF